jgi:adenylate kinase family enzyme
VRDYKFKHLSVGDLLRAEKGKGGPEGEKIAQTMKEGKLVPSELSVKLIRKAIAINGVRRYLIDGFPRNKENWKVFQETMKEEVVVKGLIYLECTDEVMTERITNKPHKEEDDNPETLKHRITTFHSETEPVLEIFRDHEHFI